MQAAFDIFAEFFGGLLCEGVFHGFDDVHESALRDVIHEGVDDVAAAAQVGFVVLGVVYVAGKTVVAPDDQPGFGGVGLKVADHFVEFIAAAGGGAGGRIDVDAREHQVVILAPFAHVVFLLLGAEFLGIAAAIADVAAEQGAGREGGVVLGHGFGK